MPATPWIQRLVSAALCLLTASVLAAAPATMERPNILFIYTDDHSHRTVGAYPEAYPWVRTPAMDRLASQGVRFEYAYIGTWCMPSRATLLTGFHQFGVELMRMVGPYPGSTYDPEILPFWPKVFRENGYFTAQIGKWHTGTDTGYGRDGDFHSLRNGPKHTTTGGNSYDDQPILPSSTGEPIHPLGVGANVVLMSETSQTIPSGSISGRRSIHNLNG